MLASSSLPWTGDDAFHLVGYSLGGGVAAAFARYFPRLLRSLVLVAPGGLIRPHHVGWKSKLLYGLSEGILPKRILEGLVRWRITPKGAGDGDGGEAVAEAKMVAGLVANEQGGTKTPRTGNSDATGGSSFDTAVISWRRPHVTVSKVMTWQIRHHAGFVPAFISSIRHAPIYDQQADWRFLASLLSERRAKTRAKGEGKDGQPGLEGGKVLLVLGLFDSVILRDEVVPDIHTILGPDAVELATIDCGHEIAIARGSEVANVAMRFWRSTRQAG